MKKPTKAVVAAAGYGTRMLPITKTIEKCMLPLLNRPVIDYVVQDLIKGGVKDIYFVVSEESVQLEAYYSRNHELEKYLKQEGKGDLIEKVKPPEGINFHYIVQKHSDPHYGTAIPLWLCRGHIDKDEQVFYVMGDQTIWRADGRSEAGHLAEVLDDSGKQAALVSVELPVESVGQYGVVATDEKGNFQGIVEKPSPEETPSSLINAGFFLLPGSIMNYIENYISVGVDGEYWIIDVLNGFAKDGNGVHVQRSNGTFLDCGSIEPWIMANELLLEYGPHLA